MTKRITRWLNALIKTDSLGQLYRLYLRFFLIASGVLLLFTGLYGYFIPQSSESSDQSLRHTTQTLISVLGENDVIKYTRFVNLRSPGYLIQITNQMGSVLYSSFDRDVLPTDQPDGYREVAIATQSYRLYQETYGPTRLVVQVAQHREFNIFSGLLNAMWPLAWCLIGLLLGFSYLVYRHGRSLSHNLRHTLALLNGVNQGANQKVENYLPEAEIAKLPEEVRLIVKTYQLDLRQRNTSLKQVQASLNAFLIKLRQPFLIRQSQLSTVPKSSDHFIQESPSMKQMEEWINCMHAWIALDEKHLQRAIPSDVVSLSALIQTHFNTAECHFVAPDLDDKIVSHLAVSSILFSFLRQYIAQAAPAKLDIALSLNGHELLFEVHYPLSLSFVSDEWQRETAEFSRQIIDKAADIIEAVLVYNVIDQAVSVQILFPCQPSQGRLL